MKSKLKVLLLAFFVFVLFYFIIKHQKVEQKSGTVVEKYTNQNKDGHCTYYHIIVLYKDGTVEDKEVNVTSYVKYKVGIQYFFTKISYQ